MSEYFTENGTVVPVTIISAGPVTVTRIFSKEKDGFEFVTLNRPAAGHPDFTEVNNILEELKEKDKKKYNELIKNENG